MIKGILKKWAQREINHFLTHLAVNRGVSDATQKSAQKNKVGSIQG